MCFEGDINEKLGLDEAKNLKPTQTPHKPQIQSPTPTFLENLNPKQLRRLHL